MYTIFCFGDSNTFGFNPQTGGRYEKNSRWTGILSELLGNNYNVINHGKNNRTFFSKNPTDSEISGLKALPDRLKGKIDLIIVSLGANDTQIVYNNKEEDYINAINSICTIIREYSDTVKIILTAPPVLSESVLDSYFSSMFDKSSILKSELLPKIYKETAKKLRIQYVDFNEIAPVSNIDGLHYTKESHIKIAEKLYEIINC